MMDTFFGCPTKGVYSPSVQKTLYEMGEAIIDNCSSVDWILLNMPNLHFNPLSPVASTFEHDVCVTLPSVLSLPASPVGSASRSIPRPEKPR